MIRELTPKEQAKQFCLASFPVLVRRGTAKEIFERYQIPVWRLRTAIERGEITLIYTWSKKAGTGKYAFFERDKLIKYCENATNL